MPDLTITIRDADLPLLDELAERDWRHREQQASAMLEQSLSTARARKTQAPRTSLSRRTRSSSNGVAAAV